RRMTRQWIEQMLGPVADDYVDHDDWKRAWERFTEKARAIIGGLSSSQVAAPLVMPSVRTPNHGRESHGRRGASGAVARGSPPRPSADEPEPLPLVHRRRA